MTDTQRPICFLDVDGVINACPDLPPEKSERLFRAEGYPICYPLGLQKRIVTLQSVFEMVWLTTWEEKANAAFPHVTAGTEWPFVEWGRFGCKLVGAKVWMEKTDNAGRPFVQIDDDFYDWECHNLKHRDFDLEIEFPQPRLHIAPNCAQGLTDKHVDQALAFVERLP